jgi:flagellar motor switch protein FliN
MSEILSQEQIDSLLSQKDMATADVSDSDRAEVSSGSAAKDYGALRKAFELFNEQAAGTISTIFNKNTVFETILCDRTDSLQLRQNLAPPLLFLTIPFRSGFEGAFQCIISQKDAAHFSDLMMMGDGTASYTDDHKDGIIELFGQIFGAYTTALGAKLGEQIGVDHISASVFDVNNPSFPLDNTDIVVAQGTVGESDQWRMHFLIPDDLSDRIMRSLSKGQKSDAAQTSGDGEDQKGISGDAFVETSLSGDSMRTSSSHENIDMLLDVDLDVYIELGRTNLSIKRILELAPGSIVELDRMAGEPVDLLVNDKVIAKGEVVVLDENFGIRIVSLVSAEDRIKSLK